VFTSDLDNEWSRFPLNPAFVPFAVETARYLTKSHRPQQSVAAVDIRESNPAATTVGEFTNAIERTTRAGLLEAGMRPATSRIVSVGGRSGWCLCWWPSREALLGRRTT
jgi:hypothetical protein